MTMWESSLVVWSFFIFTLLSATFLSNIFKNKKYNNNQNDQSQTGYKFPPGRRSWPLIGDSFDWYSAIASSHPSKYVEEQAKRYGKIFSCRVFGKCTVVSVDPEFNRYVMQNEGILFQSSYPKSFRDLVGVNGVITAQGEQQRKLHGIASNFMRINKLNFSFLKEIQTIIIHSLTTFHDRHQIISLQDACRKIAINVMVSQLLGVSSDSEVNEISGLFYDFVDGCLSFPINLPPFAYYSAMKARKQIIRKIKKKMKMQKSMERMSSSSSSSGHGVLARLLEEQKHLCDEAVEDFIINLLFAGNETTSKTMLFAVYYLTHSPKAFNQLLDEQDGLRNRCGDNTITWQDYKSMSFTQCVIDETLRLGGIAIWLMRETKEEIKYSDYVIPKGTFVVPFLSAVHLDENIYDEALTFNPWRWMQLQNQEKRNWKSSPYFAPFGGGARLCPGAELARLQIALFLHHFVTNYRWTQVKADRMSFFPSARLVNGFQIHLKRREH
ncbi:abietadienol/abietadienal oxidase [Cucumis melo]|uniref:Abietadienol/abietadienal oxidase n=1 Tax=Cucumis melo TaxID=3656 RepID=A0A1S4E208_CUCME|nr:abietadienol/abietadienal oxidase [Cucumis melo]